MSRIYGKIGFAGLWNGLPVRIAMIGTLTAFQWLIYDTWKVTLGVSTLCIHATTDCLLNPSCSFLLLVATDVFNEQ